MTVIFHTNAGMPLLAGDMLISVPGPKAYTDLRLPSQPDGITVPADPTPSYIPILMRRKTFILNDHLAVGAAGSALHVRSFINALTDRFRDSGTATWTEVRDHLDEYASSPAGNEALGQIGMLMLVEADDRRGSLTGGAARRRDVLSQRFGRVVSIGSGAESITKEIQRIDSGYRFGMTQPLDGDRQYPEFSTLWQNLHLLANLYWREFTSPRNLFSEAWGGAYDVVYQDSGGVFRYLDEYTLFLRLYDVAEPNKGIQLINVLRYERRPEVSFVTMMNKGKLDLFGAKDITASDDPITVTLKRDAFTMNSRLNISIIAVGKAGSVGTPMVQVDGLGPDEREKQTAFTYFDDEDRLCVAFHAEHDEWLQEQAESHYRQHADAWQGSESPD